MGVYLSKIFYKLIGTKEMRIIMVGLDGVGKTTILHQLHLGKFVTTTPTVGFNVETVRCKNIDFTIWDICGRSKIHLLYRHYYQNTKGVIYVVDSNDIDPTRIDEAREELQNMLAQDELRDAAIVVFANKQDLPRAMSVSEVTDQLKLREVRDRIWHIQATCAKTGDGLHQGLGWLATNIDTR